MIALTIGGQPGAGAPEIGAKISKSLGYRYVEHLALRRLARRLDATAEAVTRKELSFGSRKNRFLQTLELMFARIGWYGADLALEDAPSAAYASQMLDGKKRMPAQISTSEYLNAIHNTADEFAAEGSLLLVKRAGCVTLRDRPEIMHVGLFAPLNLRVARVSRRLGIGTGEAEDVVTGLEHARAAWFNKIGDADPLDPTLYDLTFDLGGDVGDDKVLEKLLLELKGSDLRSMDDGYDQLLRPDRQPVI
ncbi:MAG: cytidylate kinase family protein [Chloroflexi bacterium]|nr:cytidylate kinase family protein [Chloroflexota bacterium]